MGDEVTTHECRMQQTIDRLKTDVEKIHAEIYGNGGRGMKSQIVEMHGKVDTTEAKVGFIRNIQWIVLVALVGNLVAVIVKAIQ